MSLTTEGRNFALNELAGVATKMRLLDETDAEILNHEAASQDQALTWGAAASGTVSITNEPAFEIPGGTTVAAVSFRSTDGATEYARDVLAVGDQESYTNDGTYTVTAASISIT